MTGSATEIIEWLMQQDRDKTFDIDFHYEKRSLTANGYFHVLCDKLRKKLNISFTRCKNELITSYGQIFYLDDGEPCIYKTNAPPEFIYEQEEPHLKLVKTVIENGKEVYYYRVFRGSHTYNSKEMGVLIDGVVAECKEQGIETLPPYRVENLLSMIDRK